MAKDLDVLRVAVAGCHRMVAQTPGGHNWGSAFAPVSDTRVVAVYDRGAETREQFRSCWRDVWGEMTPYDDFQRMLAEVKPDILCLATRQTYHAEQVEEAARAGVRGIIVEKPLATTLEEADRIFGACTQAKMALAEGLELRWSEQYRAISKSIRDGAIGEVTNVIAYGVSDLINHGCHWYDVALMMAGDPEPVWASGLVDDLAPEITDWRRGDPPGRGWIGLDNGVRLTILSEGGSRAYTVLGTRGRITILNEGNDAYLWETVDETTAFGKQPRTLDLPTSTEPWPRGPAVVRDLVNAVRTGGKTACDVPEARRATEIGFAIHASSALGGARVSFPVTDRTLRIDSRPWGNE